MLGAGQDWTPGLRGSGLDVTALDYAAERPEGAASSPAIDERAREGSWSLRCTTSGLLPLPDVHAKALVTAVHDVRQLLPLPDASVDVVYSHMLFTMALTTPELERLAGEVHRMLRPGGLHVYTVRHTGDAHYGTGTAHGDNMFENGGFVVHFFDRAMVDRLGAGFTLLDLTAFEEGDLPRLVFWRVTSRRDSGKELLDQATPPVAREILVQPQLPGFGAPLSRRSAATRVPVRYHGQPRRLSAPALGVGLFPSPNDLLHVLLRDAAAGRAGRCFVAVANVAARFVAGLDAARLGATSPRRCGHWARRLAPPVPGSTTAADARALNQGVHRAHASPSAARSVMPPPWPGDSTSGSRRANGDDRR